MQNFEDIQINADQLEKILNEPTDFYSQPKEQSSQKGQKVSISKTISFLTNCHLKNKPSWAKTEK